MKRKHLRLKKNEDRRIRRGHPWVYSNEIDTRNSPLKDFDPGEEVIVESHDKIPLGVAYVNPHSLITARIFSRNLQVHLDTNFIIHHIHHALQLRDHLFKKPYYRLIFGESDGLPGLIVDRFADILAVQLNTAGMEKRIDLVLAALKAALPDTQSILLRNDGSQRKLEGLETYIREGIGSPPQKIILEENGVLFYAPLWEGQKTGWFYDHRLNRLRLKDYVAGLRILDVFTYLGAWGIQAAVWGAKEVTCVDVSSLSETFIKENARANHVEDKIEILIEDVFIALKSLSQAGKKYDLIILDPPAFIKKQKDKKTGFIAYQRINEAALKLLKENGILISCSCSMHLSYEDLVQILQRSSFHTGSILKILERGHQGPDHPIHLAIPETDYLKMIITCRLG